MESREDRRKDGREGEGSVLILYLLSLSLSESLIFTFTSQLRTMTSPRTPLLGPLDLLSSLLFFVLLLPFTSHAFLEDAALPFSVNCTMVGEQLCSADAKCAAFGVYGNSIQLHGCVQTVPNTDWSIFVRRGDGYTQLPLGVNINEDACTQHPDSGMEHPCGPPPPPPPPPSPPSPPHYTVMGSVDVGTYENTIFYWKGVMYNLENIACSYWDHAGIWDSFWGNNSYARVRELESGRVVSNVSTTRGFGFVSAFADYEHDVMWLFGAPANRCKGNGPNYSVQAWWSKDLVNWQTSTILAYPHGTYNVQVK